MRHSSPCPGGQIRLGWQHYASFCVLSCVLVRATSRQFAKVLRLAPTYFDFTPKHLHTAQKCTQFKILHQWKNHASCSEMDSIQKNYYSGSDDDLHLFGIGDTCKVG